MKKLILTIMVICTVLLLASCGTQPGVPTPQATATPAIVMPPTVTETSLPTQTELPPTANPVNTQTPPVLVYPPDISASVYLDDRSTPASLILSYYNAVNKKEYLRAYSYWGDPATVLGAFDAFAKGYEDTDQVSVSIGKIYAEGAAGTSYYTIPVILNVTKVDQSKQKYAACYIARLPQPGNYAVPPITPMNLYRGTAKVVDQGTSDAAALGSACSGPDYPTGGNGVDPVLESLQDISSANYIDNRSGAVELIISYFNALNRMEVVRAYSYWKNPAAFSDFEAVYTDFGQVTAITFGETTSDAGAGQMYFQTPVVLGKTASDRTTILQSACFVMHLSQPTFQAAPPFDPLGITSLTLNSVTGSTDPLTLLSTACP